MFVLNADKFLADHPAFDAFTSVLDVVQHNKTKFLPRFRVPWCSDLVGFLSVQVFGIQRRHCSVSPGSRALHLTSTSTSASASTSASI